MSVAAASSAKRTGKECLRVVVIGPSMDVNDIGEVFGTVKWLQALSKITNLTVLSTARVGAVPLAQQLPDARVVTWPEARILYQRFARINALAKPGWPIFAYLARRWIKQAQECGDFFDIAHQILPQAMRHATPLRNLGMPYVLGPLGGGLETPPAFVAEVSASDALYTRLRAFDSFRLRHDPRLRASYREASLIVGVGPYIAEHLAPIGIKRFEAMHEIARNDLPPPVMRATVPGRLSILHVGRIVRTKGLRDTIRALAYLKDLPDISLVSAGSGDDRATCEAEVARLGLTDKVTFLGRVPRGDVEQLYRNADVFCFPSFREPLGGVLLEAMMNNLPIVTAAQGGPDFVVDNTCGIRIPVTDPEQFPRDIAAALRMLANDPVKRLSLGEGARARMATFDDWETKARRLLALYHDVLADQSSIAS